MNTQRGNILFLILLAVVLFAALSYAVTQSTRGGGNDAKNESAQAKTGELMNYFAQMDAAVQRMMLTGGVKDYELNFYYQSTSKFVRGGNDNPNCTESRCRVFDPAGGGVSGMSLYPRYTKPVAQVQPERLFLAKIPGVGTDKLDIVYAFHGVDHAICAEINKRAGLSGILYNITQDTWDTVNWPYNNVIPTGPIADNNVGLALPVAAGLAGTFCYCRYAEGNSQCAENWQHDPTVMHVLVAR